MLLFNILCNICFFCFVNFNTSNVTIQPRTASPSSSAIDISIHLMLLFNAHPFRLIFLLPYFNTSNVTIQPIISQSAKWYKINFNTSNVTIQRLSKVIWRHYLQISIHLMLLFNQHFQWWCWCAELFQYI